MLNLDRTRNSDRSDIACHQRNANRLPQTIGQLPLLLLVLINLAIALVIFLSTDGPVALRYTTVWLPFGSPEMARDPVVSAWAPASFGQAAPLSELGVLVFYIVQSALADAWVTQAAFILAPFWLACGGMYLLLRMERISDSAVVEVLGPLIYAYNGLTVTFLGSYLVMYAYASLPLTLLAVVRTFRRPSDLPVNSLLLALAISLGTLFYPIAGISYMLPISMAGLLVWILSPFKSLRGGLMSVGTVIFGFVLHVALTFPFVFPHLVGLTAQGVSGYARSSGFMINMDFLSYLRPWTFDKFLSWSNVPLLLTWREAYPAGPIPEIALGYLVFLLTPLSLFSREKSLRVLSVSLWVPSLLIVAFGALVRQSSTLVQLIYGPLPFLWPINGGDVYAIILVAMLSILLTLSVVAISHARHLDFLRGSGSPAKHPAKAFLLVSIVLLSPVCFAFLVQSLPLARPGALSDGELGETYPKDLIELARRLDQERTTFGPFRVLWLPQTNRVSAFTYTNDPLSDFTMSGVRILNPVLYERFRLLVKAMTETKNASIGTALALLGFRYVVVLRDPFSWAGGSVEISTGQIDQYLTGDPGKFEAFFDMASDLSILERTPSYSLYRNRSAPENWYGSIWATANLSSPLHVPLNTLRILDVSPRYAPTKYLIETNSTEMSWLVFLETYDLRWGALASVDGGNWQPLEHTIFQGWANGFRLPGGIVRVLLLWAPQTDRDRLFLIWRVLAPVSLAGLILLWMIQRRQGLQSAVHIRAAEEMGSRATLRGACRD